MRPIERRDVSVEFRRFRFPQIPPWMLDPIFAAARAARGVTPVMLGNKFFVRSLRRGLRFARGCHGERFPAAAAPPLILSEYAPILMLKIMPHRQRGVRLVIKGPGHDGNGPPRNQFADKYHPAPPFLRAFTADIEPKIHLLEIAME